MINKIKIIIKKNCEILTKLKEKDFFSFILSTTISRIMSFMAVIFLARILSKYDYGVLSYVDNLRNYVLLLSGLGMSNVVLRYCSQKTDMALAKGYFVTAFKVGLYFNIVLVFISIVFYLLFPANFEDSTNLLLLMSLLPIFIYIFDCIQISFRATFQNKIYAKLSIIYSFAMVTLQIIFCIYWSLVGVAVSRYIACIVGIIVAVTSYRKSLFYKIKASEIPNSEIKPMLYLGISLLVASAASIIMTYNETYLLGVILGNAVFIADYKIGSIFMQISYFVVTSISLFTFPIFSKHFIDKKWIWNNSCYMIKCMFFVMTPIHLLLIILTPDIISIIFGREYLSAVSITRVLLMGSFIQTVLRIPLGNILVAVNKEHANLYINLVSMVVHFLLNILCLKLLGIRGAGYAIAFIYLLSSLAMLKSLHLYCCVREKEE